MWKNGSGVSASSKVKTAAGAAGTAAAVMAVAVGVCLKQSQYERDHFVVEENSIYSPKIKKRRTLVFLSDIHDKEFGPGGSRLLTSIRDIRPDAVLIGGDTMVAKAGKASLEVTRRLIRGLSEFPIFYGNGNHEQRLNVEREIYGTLYDEFLEMLKEEGVHYLSDSSAVLGEDIRISGLNLDNRFYRDFVPAKMTSAYVYSRLGRPDPTKYQILMAHSPLFHKTYASWGADLSLSGHFHGGTIRLPVLGGVMTPQFQFFLPCCAGTFEKRGRYMIVSRGLGTHSINIRLWNKPQLVVIHLEPKEPDAEK